MRLAAVLLGGGSSAAAAAGGDAAAASSSSAAAAERQRCFPRSTLETMEACGRLAGTYLILGAASQHRQGALGIIGPHWLRFTYVTPESSVHIG
jgi:hypothetical protein